MNQQAQVANRETTRERYEGRVRAARRKLEQRRAEVPVDPNAIASAEMQLAQAELQRDSLIEASELSPPAEPINFAQPMPNTSPVATAAPRWLASGAAAAALSAEERRVAAARDRVIAAEREHAEATALGRRYPDAEEIDQRRAVARAALTELELKLGEREGDLAALRETLASSEIAEADRLLVEGSADATEKALGPLVADAERLGSEVGALLLRAYGVVDGATGKRDRAWAIVRKLGLATPKNPEEYERSAGRYRLVRGLRAGLAASLGNEVYNALDALTRWVK